MMMTTIDGGNIMAVDTKQIQLGFYCEDDEYKLYGPFKSMKDCEKYDYSFIWELKKIAEKDKKINKITVDFTSSTLTIEGEKNCSIKILDKVLGNGVHSFAPDSWQVVLGICKAACANTFITGKPTIEGEYLNEVLHL